MFEGAISPRLVIPETFKLPIWAEWATTVLTIPVVPLIVGIVPTPVRFIFVAPIPPIISSSVLGIVLPIPTLLVDASANIRSVLTSKPFFTTKLYYTKSHFPLEISQRAFDHLWRVCESYEMWCKETKQKKLIILGNNWYNFYKNI